MQVKRRLRQLELSLTQARPDAAYARAREVEENPGSGRRLAVLAKAAAAVATAASRLPAGAPALWAARAAATLEDAVESGTVDEHHTRAMAQCQREALSALRP